MSYFLPINVNGLQGFTQSGEGAGWYQLAVPGAVLPTVPGIIVPPEATGVLLQAIAIMEYSQSPAQAIADPSNALSMPGGGTIFISGQEALSRLCFKLPANGAQFVLQFYSGNIGPIPHVN
jgi:hypothetical protein